MRNSPKPLPSGLVAEETHSFQSVVLRHFRSALSLALWFVGLLVLPIVGTTSFAQVPVPCTTTNAYPCIYAANNVSGTVSVIGSQSNTRLGDINIGTNPLGVVVSPDNAFAYVPFENVGMTFVGVIDTKQGLMVQSIGLTNGQKPTQLAVSPFTAQGNYFVWVAEPADDCCTALVEVIDSTSNSVAKTISGFSNPTAVAISPDGARAYVADSCTGGVACVVELDAQTYSILTHFNIPTSMTFFVGSVVVTPDGKLVCASYSDMNGALGVAFIDPVSQTVTAVSTNSAGVPSDYGLGVTSDGTLYAAAPFNDQNAALNALYVFNTTTQTLTGHITVGSGPAGVAVASDGQTVYVTNSVDNTVSALRGGIVIGGTQVGMGPQGIAAMPSIPPAITTQPAGQQIQYGGMATLTVAATGTAPLTYQWYQGQSGDTSNPVQGATGTSFITPALTMTTSYWVRVTNRVASTDSLTATVTVLPPVPPMITTQPADQLIGIGSEATLSVQATGSLPLSYQWFQGQSGDTSMPLQGATGPSFTTQPLNTNTSYWVQVTNLAGSVNSSTATVTVAPVPTCMLSLRAAGGSPLSITATATCTDNTMPPQPLTTTLDWGDNSPLVMVSGGSLTATHTYLNVAQYDLVVTAVNSVNLVGKQQAYLDLRPVDINPPIAIFQGQSANFVANVMSPGPVKVNFECTVVVDSNNNVIDASSVGISCYAVSQPITLLNNTSTQVTIVIQTSGAAQARLSRPRRPGTIYAVVVPAFGLVFLPGGASLFIRRRRFQRLLALFGVLSVLIIFTSCGGGFTPPHNQTATPPDTYHVSVVDMLADNTGNPAGFVQTTLIVPLRVDQFQ